MAVTTAIIGQEFAGQLCEALDLPVEQMRRIIIDVQYDRLVVVYAEMFASQKILDVDWGKGLEGAQVRVIDKK